MRIQSAKAFAPSTRHAQRMVQVPYVFECTSCDAVELRQTQALPRGWQTKETEEDIQAYCPDCAIDLIAEAIQ